ncbi:MAG: glycosyl transferase family 2 [Bacteroidetes bacterium]|nr:glycosyl transferase family 2 [Bacteroidota bacterium]
MPVRMKVSVIIATLNEAQAMGACLQSVHAAGATPEIIVVDGGSTDATVAIAREGGALVLRSPAGRGMQFNVGARYATGDVLVFLHADTLLPENAFLMLRQKFSDPRVQAGTFRMKFSSSYFLLRLYAYFTRFDSVFTSFGDQGIAIRRSFLNVIGGFPEWPLFEDVCLLQKARKRVRVHSFPATVTTSARRFLTNGILRQQIRNAVYLLLYLLGVPPAQLARMYYRSKRPSSSASRLRPKPPDEDTSLKKKVTGRTVGSIRASSGF